MASFTLRNKLPQALAVSWFDVNGDETSFNLAALDTLTFDAQALTVQTQRLIADGYLATNTPNSPFVLQAPSPTQVQPLAYLGTWGNGMFLNKGWVINYLGSLFLVLNSHTASTSSPPDTDTTNYLKFALAAPEAFFGISSEAFSTGQLIIKTSLGWENDFINDDNVNAISQSKITNLTSDLTAKVAKAGSTMTGFLVLHADPTSALHAAPKQYVDTFLRKSGSSGERTMLAPLILAGTDSNILSAVPKGYVDTQLATKLSLAGGTMTGALVLSGSPSSSSHAANRSYVDTGLASKLSLTGGTITGDLVLTNSATVSGHATHKLYVDTAITTSAATKVAKGGDTMTGFLVLHADPDSAMKAATKQYVDTQAGLKLSLTGGNLTGAVTFSGAGAITVPTPASSGHATTKTYVDTADALKLPLAGGTITGAVTFSGGSATLTVNTPTLVGHATTKTYVDSAVAAIDVTGKVAKGGDTMTGFLVLHADPDSALKAATKQYVDLHLLIASNLSDVANVATARSNLGAAESGANTTITSLAGLLTPLSEGQGGTGAATYAGARTNLAVSRQTFVTKSADTSRSSTTTSVADADLVFTVAASEIVHFEFFALASSASATPDLKCGITGPASPTALNWRAMFQYNTDIAITNVLTAYDANGLTGNITTTGVPHIVRLVGTLINGVNAGTVSFCWAQSVSDPTAVTILKGSIITIHRNG